MASNLLIDVVSDFDSPPSYEEAMIDPPNQEMPPPYVEAEHDRVSFHEILFREYEEEYEDDVEEEYAEEENEDHVETDNENNSMRFRDVFHRLTTSFEMIYDINDIFEDENLIMSFRDLFQRLTTVFQMIYILLTILVTHMKIHFKVKQFAGWKKIMLLLTHLLKINTNRCVIQVDKLDAKRHFLLNFNEECERDILIFDPRFDSAIKILVLLYKIIHMIFSIGVTQMLLMMHMKVHQGIMKVLRLIMDQVDLNKSVHDDLLETLVANGWFLRDIIEEYDMSDNLLF
jgi:hypothetical protein